MIAITFFGIKKKNNFFIHRPRPFILNMANFIKNFMAVTGFESG
jgi:hypothetical protein